jgi:hypothetical protein
VAHTSNPATWEAKIKRIEVPGQPRPKKKKFVRPNSIEKKDECGGTHLSHYIRKCKEGDGGPGWPGQKEIYYLKNN